MSGTFTDDEAKILRALAEGRVKQADIKAVKAADRKKAIDALAARGLVERSKDGRSEYAALTAAGREALAVLPVPAAPEKKTAARAKKPATAAAPDEELISATAARVVAALAPQLARIEAKLDALGVAAPATRSVAPVLDDATIKRKVLEAVRALDLLDPLRGMVPIPHLRTALRKDGVSAPDAAVNDALFALEREKAVDLLIAQSPNTVADRAAGIEPPGRGLVYYVALRSA